MLDDDAWYGWTKRWKKQKENSLPILMFTSKNDSISKVRAYGSKWIYLTKPFDMDELIARIASLIRRYTCFNHQAGAVQNWI